MSAADVEKELQQLIDNSGYEVVFDHRVYLRVRVLFNGHVIEEWSYFGSLRVNPYRHAARKAKRVARRHKKAMRIVAGMVRQGPRR